MKTIFKTILTLSLIPFIFGCKKNDNSSPQTQSTKFSQIYSFENNQSLSEWALSGSGGNMTIDSSLKKTGNGSLHLKQSSSLCSFLKLKNGLSVKAGHSYTINFDGKSPNESFIGDTIGTGCAFGGGFDVLVYMRDEYSPLTDLSVFSTDWKNYSAVFKADSSGKPLYIKFFIGARNGWFDNISIKEN